MRFDEKLPEAPLAFSQAENELLSAKEVPPAFTLPDKVLSSRGGSSLFSLKSLSLAVPLLSGVGKVVVSSSDVEFHGPSGP